MTAQASERLKRGDKELRMCTTPLDTYLRQSNIEFESSNTANWRGYVGTWEIKGADGVERLYLVGLSANKSYEEILSLSDLFPDHPNGVFAHWFTGEVRCPTGNLIDYVHGGYASKYEYDYFFEFKKGVLVNQRAVHNTLDEDKGA
ncbi:hypothetical protein [Polynucleobacter antarcticus]|uniref:Uncharacterized protein n=1 Tax=Polynucleobacter antarcticus TaxID=1743162 RepID=A0A6M9PXU1_9BURK|nr:hypothetical protein [Polynucleobacter antarcticus]QKM62686.1 hypothetical protein DCO16_06230 [Polynucleobacter antarcticus]